MSVAKAGFSGVLFDKAPTYEKIVSGTTNLLPVIALNRVFGATVPIPNF